MQKLLLLACLWAAFAANIKAQHINDYGLANAIRQQCPTCIDWNNDLLPDAANLTHLTIRMAYLTTYDLSDLHYLTGLQFFDCDGAYVTNFNTCPANLDTLICRNNYSMSVLPTLPNTLRYLDCSDNNFVAGLPTLPPALTYLDCASNNLNNLPALPTSLFYLNCSNNPGITLPSLPTLPTTLTSFICASNQWNALPTLPNTLEVLNCENNPIGVLPTLPPTITYLNCNNNQLNTLPTLSQSLTYLNCGRNQLPNLAALPPNLVNLICNNNQFTVLPALPASLETIDCSYNQISVLPTVSNAIKEIDCSYNQITALPALSNCLNLNVLHCGNNQITTLPVLANNINLQTLNIVVNQITTLPALPPNLVHFYCNNNQITSIPTLPAVVVTLHCANNQITSLSSLPTALTSFNCSDNPNLNCLPWLPGGLISFSFGGTAVTCVPNRPNPYVYIGNLGICVPNNNANNCVLYNTIEGRVYLDADNDGVYNNNDVALANKLVYNNVMLASTTDSNGMYALALNFNNTSTVTIGNWVNRAYYSVNPNSYTITSNNTTQQFINNDFRIVPNSAGLDVEVRIEYGRYRPGFDNVFWVVYENVGNTVADGSISVNLDNQTTFLSAMPTPDLIQFGNNLTFNYTNLQPFEQRRIFIEVNLPATASIGDIISNRGSISTNNTDINLSNNTFRTREIVVGAYDPNDINANKRAICMDLPDEIYQPIEYKIRFQNTGTFYAEDVIVTDTLSPLLDIRTFQQLSASHDYNLEIENILHNGQLTQVLKWVFNDIYLIDSFTNEPLSHGFINYKIRPKTTPAINYGQSINSQAHIYFDFNPAVNTNINELRAQDCMNSVFETPNNYYNFDILPNPNKGIFNLQINAATLGANQLLIYNQLGQLVFQQQINTTDNFINLNCSHLKAGVYSLQITGERGIGTKTLVISY